jgi:hypothetical protein
MLMGLGSAEKDLARIDFENLNMELFQDLVTAMMASLGPKARQKLVEATN